MEEAKGVQLAKDDPVINAIRTLAQVEERLRQAVNDGNAKDALLAIEELQENKVKVEFKIIRPGQS